MGRAHCLSSGGRDWGPAEIAIWAPYRVLHSVFQNSDMMAVGKPGAPNPLVLRRNSTARSFLRDLRGVLESMGSVAVAILTAILIGTLYLGREVFVPIALAVLLSFVLAPLASLLQRCHVPRGLSVISVVLLAFVSIFAVGSFGLLSSLPRSWRTSAARSSVPLVAAVPRTVLIFSRMFDS